MLPARRPNAVLPAVLIGAVLCLSAPVPTRAQVSGQEELEGSGEQAADARERGRSADPRFHVYAYSFRHQSAGEALPLIRPLLSARGSVEHQPGNNTLVLRDTLATLGRILPVLRAFDRPPRQFQVEVMILRASSAPEAHAGVEELPQWLEEKLRSLLRWDYYTLLARSGVEAREGEDVTHEIGGLYRLSFHLGTLLADERLKLEEFRFWRPRSDADEPLIEATLNLQLEKPKVLGLADSESSERALMVVLTCSRAATLSPPDGRPQVSPAVPDDPPGGGR